MADLPPVYIKLHRPEGYEDVHPDLVLQDAHVHPAFQPEVVAAPVVDEAMVDVLRIPAQPGLDPITVYFEDYAPGRGRITVACFGDAWTAAWGAIGDRSVREFVSSVGPGYLAGAMQELSPPTTKAHRKYTERVAGAITAALSQQPGEVDRG